jgi:hypothetical protein
MNSENSTLSSFIELHVFTGGVRLPGKRLPESDCCNDGAETRIENLNNTYGVDTVSREAWLP